MRLLSKSSSVNDLKPSAQETDADHFSDLGLHTRKLKEVTGHIHGLARNLVETSHRSAELAKTTRHLPGEQLKRAWEESFRTIADSMPELISYVDADLCYQFNNKTYEKWFGLPVETFKGRSIREALGEGIFTIIKPCIDRVLAGQPTSYEGFITYRALGRRYIHIDYLPRKDRSGVVEGFFAIIRDLTELKDAEQKCRTFLETAPDAMVITDSQGAISMVNDQTERMFGYSERELIGQPVEMLMPERFRAAHLREQPEHTEPPVTRLMGAGQELYGLRKDGFEFPVEVSLSPVETAEGIYISRTIRDVTDRKLLAEQIRWAAILEERSRLARDVHDTLAQGFTGIILNLEAAEQACADLPQEVRERIALARKVARESLNQARRSVLALSNALPPSGNLATAVRNFADRYRTISTKTRVEVSIRGLAVRLEPAIEENLLHIAQQATDNALQHARAGNLRIDLSFEKRLIQLQIQDNGRGFDVKKARRGVGLIGMRERASAIGGAFELESKPGIGTSIRVSVALAAPKSLAVSR